MLDLTTLRETLDALPVAGPFSPDGKRVASGDTVWNLGDKTKAPVKYNLSESTIFQFLTDRIGLASAGVDTLVWLLDEKESKPLAKLLYCRAVGSPGGKLIAVAPRVGDVALGLQEVSETGVKLKFTLPGPEGMVRAGGETYGHQMAFSLNGRLALVTDTGRANASKSSGFREFFVPD